MSKKIDLLKVYNRVLEKVVSNLTDRDLTDCARQAEVSAKASLSNNAAYELLNAIATDLKNTEKCGEDFVKHLMSHNVKLCLIQMFASHIKTQQLARRLIQLSTDELESYVQDERTEMLENFWTIVGMFNVPREFVNCARYYLHNLSDVHEIKRFCAYVIRALKLTVILPMSDKKLKVFSVDDVDLSRALEQLNDYACESTSVVIDPDTVDKIFHDYGQTRIILNFKLIATDKSNWSIADYSIQDIMRFEFYPNRVALTILQEDSLHWHGVNPKPFDCITVMTEF